MHQTHLLNVRYHNITCRQALDAVAAFLDGNEKRTVCFLNADCLRQAQKDLAYRDILNSADLVLSDGIGLRIASKLYGDPMVDNCNGTDLSPKIMAEAAKHGKKIFLLGGQKGVAERAAENMRARVDGIQIVGAVSGYDLVDEDVITQINDSGADILFVAMGVPRQEKWIAKYRDRLSPKVCLGVGALLDYLSGSIPRAPLWMQKCHIEWFWRIFVDPQRMIKRYLVDGVGFMVYVVWRRLKK